MVPSHEVVALPVPAKDPTAKRLVERDDSSIIFSSSVMDSVGMSEVLTGSAWEVLELFQRK